MASVSVGIVDNGFDIEHEDLSVGLLNEGVNSYEDHGTHVSGLVGATMDNLDSTKEWPNIYDDKMKDYMALRGDWDNVGKSIRKETRNFKRTSFRH